MEETQILAEKLKSALDEYNSYNGESLTSVILYMREAERVLKVDKNPEQNKKLENLVLECKRKIVENNLGLVIKIARFYRNITNERSYYDDFFSEGIVGLLNAIPGYDIERGKFSNYACTCIRQNINRKIREILGNIKLPVNLPFYERELDYFLRMFKEKYKRKPIDKEFAKFSGKPVKRIKELREMSNLFYTVSINAKIHDEERGDYLLDHLDYYKNSTLEDEIIKKITIQELVKCINKLPKKKWKKVLMGRLERKSFMEIGLEMNLTRARIEQIEKKAIKQVEKMEEFQRLRED